MKKQLQGSTRRTYTTKKRGLDVVIDISVNTNPLLAKLLGQDPKDSYMFAELFLTDEKGLCELCKPYNKDGILEALGCVDNGKRISIVTLKAFKDENSVDRYAENILSAI